MEDEILSMYADGMSPLAIYEACQRTLAITYIEDVILNSYLQ